MVFSPLGCLAPPSSGAAGGGRAGKQGAPLRSRRGQRVRREQLPPSRRTAKAPLRRACRVGGSSANGRGRGAERRRGSQRGAADDGQILGRSSALRRGPRSRVVRRRQAAGKARGRGASGPGRLRSRKGRKVAL